LIELMTLPSTLCLCMISLRSLDPMITIALVFCNLSSAGCNKLLLIYEKKLFDLNEYLMDIDI
jgi:hypothetical protein